MPEADWVSIAVRPRDTERDLPASWAAKGLSRQASRIRMLTRSSRCIWRSTSWTLTARKSRSASDLQRGVDRQEIVLVADGDAVAGIIDDAGLGAVELLGEFADDAGHLVHLQVVAFDDLEAEPLQRGRDRLGVAQRIRQRRHRRIGAIADDEGDAALRGGVDRRSDSERTQQKPQRDGDSVAKHQTQNSRSSRYPPLSCCRLFSSISRRRPREIDWHDQTFRNDWLRTSSAI